MCLTSRDLYDVLEGEDPARPLFEASKFGNHTALQSLLLQPKWIKTMLEETCFIFYESRPKQGPNDERKVSLRSTSNLERAMTVAAMNGYAAVVSSLFAFAKYQGIEASKILPNPIIYRIIGSGHAAVFKAMASADPGIINRPIAHGMRPLSVAVRRRKVDMASVMLELGANPLLATDQERGTYHSSLMSFAGFSDGPRMTKLLLEYNTPITHTGALHTAARRGQLDTMRLLMQHGADLNEILSGWNDKTPMHFAASEGQVGAMKLLEQSGARSDLKDRNGKSPAQLLEEHTSTHS
jgi:hypothetical protein